MIFYNYTGPFKSVVLYYANFMNKWLQLDQKYFGSIKSLGFQYYRKLNKTPDKFKYKV